MKLNLILPLSVSINKLYINQYVWNPKKKERVPTGKRILSKEGVKVKNQIQAEARVQAEEQGWTIPDETKFVIQDSTFFFPRTDFDDNNQYKLLNDSLEGIVYGNDKKVITRTERIYYDTKDPHIEVTLEVAPFVGIFDSQDEADAFESNCMSCSRYRKGSCSILKEVLESRIREEVPLKNKTCSAYTKRKTK